MRPSALEMMLRSFLASRLDVSGKSAQASCSSNAECTESCQDFSYEKNGRECVLGSCVCSLAYYHTAIDTGIAPDETPDFFKVVQCIYMIG
jgi:hypothetical protein